MKPTHLIRAFQDFARTGRASREALADFIREGLVTIDEYGSPTLTSHGVGTLKTIEKGI